MNNTKIITIDGPSGVGKGTLTRRLAKHFGYRVLDSGAIYRLAGLHISNQKITTDNPQTISDALKDLDIHFEANANETRAFLDGKDVSETLRTEATGMLASKIAAYPEVREALMQKQRDFAQGEGLVADGRDMGTLVFPDAQHKIFLDANIDIRAQRRYDELKSKGIDANYDKIHADLAKRDHQDRTRTVAPLVPAENAFVLDSTTLDADAVLQAVLLWMS